MATVSLTWRLQQILVVVMGLRNRRHNTIEPFATPHGTASSRPCPGPAVLGGSPVAAPLLVMSYVICHRTWGSTVTEALLSRAPPVVSLGGLCSRVIQFLYHTHAASPSSSRQITPASGHPFPPSRLHIGVHCLLAACLLSGRIVFG